MNPRSLIFAPAALADVLLAAFFAFVGWSKATAPVEVLARYHAWTVYIPEGLGRAVGFSEVVLAAGLLTMFVQGGGRLTWWSALFLIANQMTAAAVHAAHGQVFALPQNAVLIALLALVAWIARPRSAASREVPQ